MMKLATFGLLLLAAVAAVTLAEDFQSSDDVPDPHSSHGGHPRPGQNMSHTLSTHIEGKSGRIRFQGQGENMNETVVVEFRGIIERNANGDEVDARPPHRARNFDDIQFSFNNEVSSTFHNVAVRNLSFYARNVIAPADGSTVLVEMFTFKESGIIPVDGVDTAVQAGTVKFNVVVLSWPFCTVGGAGLRHCDDEGAFLDVVLRIGSEGQRENTEGDKEPEFAREVDHSSSSSGNRHFRLGATNSTAANESPANLGPELILSSKVTVDGALSDQPEGFPKSDGDVREQRFVFRFPRGDEIYYDPVLTLAGSTGSSAMSVAANALLVLLSMVMALVVHS